MNSKVDAFIKKQQNWKEETGVLRKFLLETKLIEDFKWNLPCYVHNESNVVIIQPFKNYLGLMFFKGSLLKDPNKILINNGPNSQAAKRFEFTSVTEIQKLKPVIKAYVKEAMEIEDAGQKVEFKKTPMKMPEELMEVFAKNAKLKTAFEGLTPGRQRAYLFYFTSAKQSDTRHARIKKFSSKILAGKGIND